jgi:hypothetical protein
MPVLTGDDISRINDFALKHGKEWQVVDNFGGGIRLRFKDGKAYVYHKTTKSFGGCGRWEWDYKDGIKDDVKEVVKEPEQTPEEEVESEESKE